MHLAIGLYAGPGKPERIALQAKLAGPFVLSSAMFFVAGGLGMQVSVE